MTAELIELSTLFSRGVTYRIPLYQRPYGWDKKLCINLVEDFQELEANPSAIHYLGNLVVQASKGDSKVQDVIDGQQRLTSLFLMLDAANSGEMKYCERLIPQTTDPVDGEAKARLNPEEDKESAVFRNFEFFKGKGVRPSEELLRRVKVSLVTLYDGEEESPNGIMDCSQTVFEKMNVEGLNLSPFDLVQNALFMRARELQPAESKVDYRKRLNEIWKNVTALFEDGHHSQRLQCLRDFLILRSWREGDVKNLTAGSGLVLEFEKVLKEEGDSIEKLEGLASEMWRHAEAWVAVKLGQVDGLDSKMSPILAKLSRALTRPATPLATEIFLRLMKPTSTFKGGRSTAFEGLFKAVLIDNFLGRSIELQDWLSILKPSDDVLPTLEDYKEKLKLKHGDFSAELKQQLTVVASDEGEEDERGEQDENPDVKKDDEVPEYENVYMKQGRLVALLEAYEAQLTKENLDTEIQYVGASPTLEHVVPQNPRPGEEGRPSEWGEVGEGLCHSLGNLTLLGSRLNSSVGNRPPSEKGEAYRSSNFAMTRKVGMEEAFKKRPEHDPLAEQDWSKFITDRTAVLAKELVKALTL